eukprot:bmy_17184T0
MSYYRCSGNFSSRSLGDHLRYSGSSYGSSYPSNLVYNTDRCSPSSCRLGSSLYTGCQETCCDPIRCQTFHVVSGPCQMSCYHRRTSMFFIPCQTTYSVSLDLWALAPSNFQSFNCGFPSLGFGSSGFQSVGCGPNAFSSLSYRSSFYLPTYLSSRSCQSLSFQPTCGPGFY